MLRLFFVNHQAFFSPFRNFCDHSETNFGSCGSVWLSLHYKQTPPNMKLLFLFISFLKKSNANDYSLIDEPLNSCDTFNEM